MQQYEDQYTPPRFDPATLIERMADGVAVLDRDWRFVYLNETGARMIGQPKAALLGRVFWEVYSESVGSIFAANYRAARDEQRPITFEEYYPPFKVWFAVTVYPSDGGVTISFADITARKAAEVALATSERRFRSFRRNTIRRPPPVGHPPGPSSAAGGCRRHRRGAQTG